MQKEEAGVHPSWAGFLSLPQAHKHGQPGCLHNTRRSSHIHKTWTHAVLGLVRCRGGGQVYSEIQGDWKVKDESRSRRRKGTEQEGSGLSEPGKPSRWKPALGAVASPGRRRACVRRDSGSELREKERKALSGELGVSPTHWRQAARYPGRACKREAPKARKQQDRASRAAHASRAGAAGPGVGTRDQGQVRGEAVRGQRAVLAHLPRATGTPPVRPGMGGRGVSRSRSEPWRSPVSAPPPSRLQA